MDSTFIDLAYKTGAGRYIQERGALRFLGQEVSRLGTKPLLVGGPTALSVALPGVRASFEKQGMDFEVCSFEGSASYEAAERFARKALDSACDVVVGVGGGRIMDLAKAIAQTLEKPVIEVPTSVATCAAYTPLSVMYTPQGAHDETWRYEWEVAAVVVDVDIMAGQPPRLVAAGMLDSLAKAYEISNGSNGIKPDDVSLTRFCAYEYARVNQDMLMRYGANAYEDVRRGIASENVDRIAFLNIALTGVVSSLTRGFHQTGLAHRIHDGLRTVFTSEVRDFLHGELVAVGLIAQASYNQMPDAVDSLRSLMGTMDMPTTLGQLGLDLGDPRMPALREYARSEEFVGADEESQRRFKEAFREIFR